MIDLQFNYPQVPEQTLLLMDQLYTLSRGVGPELMELAPYAGDAECRAVCAEHLRVPRERVVLAPGGHSGIFAALVAAELTGKTLAVEPLTYASLQVQARTLGIRIAACAMDADGLLPESLEQLCIHGNVAALYTMPTIHNPTTTTCKEHRRRQIASLAEQYGFWIVEDDAYRFLHDAPPPSYLDLLPERTLHVESFSKPVFPALKLAALALPGNLIERAAEAVRHFTTGTATLSAQIVTGMLEAGAVATIIAAKRLEGARRQRMARGILGNLQVDAHPNSWHLWAHMPAGVRADAVSGELEARGVGVSAARYFTPPGVVAPECIRIALSAENDQVRLSSGLQAVADVLHDAARTASL